jgi:hypothetical protein
MVKSNRSASEVAQEIENMVIKLKKRPAMYLGNDDIRRFRHFIDGIYTALEICGVDHSPIIDYNFTRWLARKHAISDTLGWCEIIEKYEKNNSIATLFELHEKYLFECKSRISDEEIKSFLSAQVLELETLKKEIESEFRESNDGLFQIKITDYPCSYSKNNYYKNYFDIEVLIPSEPYLKPSESEISQVYSIWNKFLVHKDLTNIYVENSVWSKKKYTSLNVWRKKRQAVLLLTNEIDDFSIAKKIGLSEIQVYWLRRAKHV